VGRLDAYDLSKYFDSIPHAKLMSVVAERIVDGGILHLIKQWLKAPVIGEDDNGKRKNVGGGKGNRKGTPQGGVISPLLANCYLHILDRIWQKRQLKRKLNAHIVRYADDFVVLCKQDVEEPLKVVRHVLERLELSLNETKTHIVDANQNSFNFLRFAIQMRQGIKTGKPYPNVRPADKSLKKIKAKLTSLTGRNMTAMPMDKLVGKINRSLRGWTNYFHYRNSSQGLEKVKIHAEQRLRTHLMMRHKVKDRKMGEGRFPSIDLYGRYGLYKVPGVAGWRTAHA
jgi:RNA-directed DNA polymerase